MNNLCSESGNARVHLEWRSLRVCWHRDGRHRLFAQQVECRVKFGVNTVASVYAHIAFARLRKRVEGKVVERLYERHGVHRQPPADVHIRLKARKVAVFQDQIGGCAVRCSRGRLPALNLDGYHWRNLAWIADE